MENKGLEPLTLCVQGRCSKPTELIPRNAYPAVGLLRNHCLAPLALRKCVVPRRVELRTSTLSVWRSNQLSYETEQHLRAI